MKILLDPGHGGWNGQKYVTPGKRSLHPVDGEWYYEGVENRKIALIWSDILEKHGHDVFFTVDPDDFRDISLTERVKIANALRPDLLVSIHSNAARVPAGLKTSSARGYGVYISPQASSRTHEVADLWSKEMSETFPELKNRGKKERLFTMVHRTICPAILLELAFHTNDDDVRLLRTWEFRFKSGLLLARILEKL